MPNSEATNLCDCERGHNGLGMGGGECDCPAGRTIRVPCEACQREGRIIKQGVNPWDEVDCGPCPECDGTAFITVETRPVTMKEIDSAT